LATHEEVFQPEPRNDLSEQKDRFDSKGRAVGNGVLLTIPEDEFGVLRPHLEFVNLTLQQVLQEPGEKIEYAYFLNGGLVSLMVVTSDARSVEVAIVGREGFVGAPLVVRVRNSSQRAIVQVPADAFRIRSDVMDAVLPGLPGFKECLHHYILLQSLQVSQLAACNRLHEIEQRLARWLLMTHDRVRSEKFPITHDLLAQMLGSGRPSITVAAGTLQRAGLIEYTRGAVTILNRKGLEDAACECYAAIRKIGSYNGMSHPGECRPY
jgi:CRP-like cAMP-binding protein